MTTVAGYATPPRTIPVGPTQARQLGILCFVVGIALCALFELHVRVPITVACLVFAVAVWIGLAHVRLSRFSFLTRYVLFLYSLPFIHSLEYVVNDISTFVNRTGIWGMTPNEYQLDLNIIERMTLAGAIGAIALVAGFCFAATYDRTPTVHHESGRPLRLQSVLFVAAMALAFSWANAPTQTIFQTAYTEATNPLQGTNFNAAYLLSYVFAAAQTIDALRDRRPHVRRYKIAFAIIVVGVIVIWFQFLRGDRECMGLVVAVGILSFSNSQRLRVSLARQRRRLLLIGAVIFGLVLIAQLVGTIRVGVVGKDVTTAVRGGEISLIHGTWSGILLTDLSAIGDFERERMSMRWGRTYIDYMLSLPPGVVAAALSYQRPLESTRGPAWAMRYAQGGIHMMVVPFMNFRTPGVLAILLLCGLLIGRIELLTSGTPGVRSLLLYATFFIIGPLWIWYGDMLFVRGVMSYYLVWWTYRLLPKVRPGAADFQSAPVAPTPYGVHA